MNDLPDHAQQLPPYLKPFFHDRNNDNQEDTAKACADAIGPLALTVIGPDGKQYKVHADTRQIISLLLIHQQAGVMNQGGDVDVATSRVDCGYVVDRDREARLEKQFLCEHSEANTVTELQFNPFAGIPIAFVACILHEVATKKSEHDLRNALQSEFGSYHNEHRIVGSEPRKAIFGDCILYVEEENLHLRLFAQLHGAVRVSCFCADDPEVLKATQEWLTARAKDAKELMIQTLKGKLLNGSLQEQEIDHEKIEQTLCLDATVHDAIAIPLRAFHANSLPGGRRTIVFSGGPGVGKTMAAVHAINERPDDCTAILISAEGLKAEQIRNVWNSARMLKPCIIVIDDGEHLLQQANSQRSNNTLALLNQLDAFRDNDGIFTIIATNYPQNIDPALAARQGRIQEFIEFPTPSAEIRDAYIRQWIATEDVQAPDEKTIDRFIEESEDCSLDLILGALREFQLYRDPEKFFATIHDHKKRRELLSAGDTPSNSAIDDDWNGTQHLLDS